MSKANGRPAPETLVWHRVLRAEDLPEGRVTTVAAGHKSVALVHYDGEYSALDNHCPHQGGPLGEGSIENGLLRCPWHPCIDPWRAFASGFVMEVTAMS